MLEGCCGGLQALQRVGEWLQVRQELQAQQLGRGLCIPVAGTAPFLLFFRLLPSRRLDP